MATGDPGINLGDDGGDDPLDMWDRDAESPLDIWPEYESLRDTKLFREYLERLASNRDLHVIITAASETGVGKTTLAFVLAILWDIHGWTVAKATLDPKEYQVLYDQVGPGSVLMLDEVEQAADSRRGGSHDNVDLSQAFATKRYRQIVGMMTAPSKSWVDDRIGEDSADYWIQAQETDVGRPKGEAEVYRLRENEHYEQSYTPRVETISWPVMDWHPEFRRLEKKKVERMEGETQTKYVRRDEHEEELEHAREDGKRQMENEAIRGLYEFGLNKSDIGEALDYHRTTILRRLQKMGVE